MRWLKFWIGLSVFWLVLLGSQNWLKYYDGGYGWDFAIGYAFAAFLGAGLVTICLYVVHRAYRAIKKLFNGK